MKIVPGCNYHTTWQKYKSMRFALIDVIDDQAILCTKRNRKTFKCDLKDLIWIDSDSNKYKEEMIKKGYKTVQEVLSQIGGANDYFKNKK